ncbi:MULTISPECIES: LuxR C-terminal-related transcriptional regulator [unclassified Mycolicibacterium]|uniref:LuxR C-terminal-related transcriptional regulator n=1 Tax=unclassified Mycolicibacterium TaxID=2636767 RepID=UPI002ED7F0B5
MTGRAEELDLVIKALTDTNASAGVVIAGPAGVGKTRLAREAAAVAARKGLLVRSVMGTNAARSIPLGVFSQWVPPAAGNPLTLVGQVIDTIAPEENDAPVLLVADDGHLFDDVSAFVVQQLAIRRRAAVLLTMRTGDTPPDALTSLWKDRHLLRLDLQSLSQRECNDLLAAALRGPVTDEAAQRAWDLTRGNMLFLRQVVEQEIAAERLALRDGKWSWVGPMAVSPTLIDVVQVYIGTAPQPVLDVLDTVSVGEPVELSVLTALAASDAIEDAERRGLITVSTTSTGAEVTNVGHPLFGEIRRTRNGHIRLRRLRGALVQAMMGGSDPVDPIRAGLLWMESDLPPDANVFSAAAWTAITRLDLVLTERFAAAAARAEERLDVTLLRAQMLILLNRGQEAAGVLETLDLPKLPDVLRANLYQLQATNLQFILGQPDAAWQYVDDALAVETGNVADALHAFRALQLATAARPTEALAVARAIDRDQLPPLPALLSIWALTIALGDLGHPMEASTYAQAGAELAAAAPEVTYQAVPLVDFHTAALVFGGYLADAIAAAERNLTLCADLPGISRSVATAILGMAVLYAGDIDQAVRLLSAALTDFDAHSTDNGVPYRANGMSYQFMTHYTEALARAGNTDAALAAMAQMQDARHPAFAFFEPDYLLATAWVAAAQEHASRAQSLAAKAADTARAHHQYAREVMCRQAGIQFGDTRHAPRLRELSTRVSGPRAPIAAAWADAVEHHDADTLMAVSADIESIGDRIAAADAAAHAARMFRRQNRRGAALTAAGRASRLIAQCSARTLATTACASPLPISDREREFAVLVAQGLSNKQIAQHLMVSVRTVDGHLSRMFNKLGLTSRAELAHLITESGYEPPSSGTIE